MVCTQSRSYPHFFSFKKEKIQNKSNGNSYLYNVSGLMNAIWWGVKLIWILKNGSILIFSHSATFLFLRKFVKFSNKLLPSNWLVVKVISLPVLCLILFMSAAFSRLNTSLKLVDLDQGDRHKCLKLTRNAIVFPYGKWSDKPLWFFKSHIKIS